MNRNRLKILQGYGEEPTIYINNEQLENVIAYELKGKSSGEQELTVTIKIQSVIYESKDL
jgi:hypothetical protein